MSVPSLQATQWPHSPRKLAGLFEGEQSGWEGLCSAHAAHLRNVKHHHFSQVEVVAL